MLENVLYAAAAVATVLDFALGLFREWKSRSDDEGKSKK